MPDHVHILAGISPAMAVAEMVKRIKAKSSKWVNEEKKLAGRFEWQSGYGAFTVSKSQVGVVRRYIQNQAEHHRRQSYKEELLCLLVRHGIEYDDRYVFEPDYVG